MELTHQHMDVAERLFSKAELGHTTIAGFLAGVQDAAQRQEIEQNLSDLRARLDAFKGEDGSFHKEFGFLKQVDEKNMIDPNNLQAIE
jgi:hypothetical protein